MTKLMQAAPLLLLSACSLAPGPSLPEPVAQMPDDFSARLQPGTYEPLEWWTTFRDPVLDAVVDSVLASNFDLAAGVARVQQARARARMARAELFPSVGASAAVNDIDTPTDAGIGAQIQALGLGSPGDTIAGFALPERIELTTYSVSADFAYELDFWGRARNDARAAGSEYLASESDFHAARIGILAETITTYFDIVSLRRQTELAGETVDVLLERESLASTRYDRGLIDSWTLSQVRQDLRNTQAGLPQLETQLTNAEARLAVLIGGYREDVEALLPEALAPEPAADPVPAGVPADLLFQRPDVRAAGQRLDAARYSIGARRAQLLPSLSLSGSIGLASADAGELFNAQQWFTNLITNLTAPIFQAGRLRNNLALAEGRFDEAAAAYGRAVVTAVNEVETALAGLENETRRHAFLASQRDEALATRDLQSQRYESGVVGYTDYLDALRTLLNVEAALAGATRDLALARLAVHRSLGGAWAAPEAVPEPRMVPASGDSENFLDPNYLGTYSIIGRDPATGELGMGVQSKAFGAGNRAMHAKGGLVIIAHQASANPMYGAVGIQLLQAGYSPEEALEMMVGSDEGRDRRQVAILDQQGRTAAWTGTGASDWKGHRCGVDYCAQGNILTGPEVVDAMAASFEASAGPLAERLMEALDAAQEAGGDARGMQSGAILVVAPRVNGGYSDRVVDIRVDDHDEPLAELRRVLNMYRSGQMLREAARLRRDGDLRGAAAVARRASAKSPENDNVWVSMAAILVEAGREDLAFDALERAVELNPGRRRTLPNDDNFESIREDPRFLSIVGR
ncbi:efflux transporter outer membrane subunit [Candidatus Palauibacter sp.]|uniref:efflux transporter outer membrane subunit n=1 Tax=Candidatus Palauibacter sp. TaxID=3101350 RepID=UPI003B0288CD